MKIYTSYYGNIQNIPIDLFPISIAGKSPDWYLGAEYKKLAPRWKFFQEWKENKDNNFYIKHYYNEVLNQLKPNSVVLELMAIVPQELYDGVVLLCYEDPYSFCHRRLVSRWLRDNGYACEELGRY